MSRLQLALNVSDLESAIAFYAKLFDAPPAKRMPGYANFSLDDPPLKLVLIESDDPGDDGVTGKLNHLGVEVMSSESVLAASARLSNEGLDPAQEVSTCCYAVQDKVWVTDPDGAPWEIYVVLADAPVETGLHGDGTCCATKDLDGQVTLATTRSTTCC